MNNDDQSDRIQRYEMGKLKSDLTTPSEHSLFRDLVATLAPYQAGETQLNLEQKKSAAAQPAAA